MTRITHTLAYGLVNKDLRVEYLFTLDTDPNSKFQTIKQNPNGSYRIRPSFALSISEGFEKDHIFIPSNKYWQFIDILSRSVNLISENLYDLFPNIGRPEFDIDTKALEIFRTEKALSVGGFSILPCVYVNENSECIASIRIQTVKEESLRIPIDDAKMIVRMLSHFDPIGYGLTNLSMLGKLT